MVGVLVVDVVLAGPPAIADAHEQVAEDPACDGDAFASSEDLPVGDVVSEQAVLGEHEAPERGADDQHQGVGRPEAEGNDAGERDGVDDGLGDVEAGLRVA